MIKLTERVTNATCLKRVAKIHCDKYCDDEVRSKCEGYQPRAEVPYRYGLNYLTAVLREMKV